ncbi:MAG: DMT family transporter [Anaerolineae bacterium]|nr:DMT family transporter [Anaerolineae bacterium]
MSANIRKGYPIAVLATTFLATTAIFIGYLTRTVGMAALLMALWRNIGIVLLLLVGLALISRRLLRLGRANVRFFLLFGLVLALFNSAWAFSVLLNGAAAATVLAYGATAFTVLLERLLFGERLRLTRLAAVALSLTGVLLVARAYDASAWRLNGWGIFAGLGVALLYAVYNLMGKETARRGISSWTAQLYSFGLAGGYLLLANLVLGGGAGGGLLPRIPLTGWLALGGLATASVLGYGLYVLSMKYLAASVSNLIATLEPVITALLAYVILGERLLGAQIVGAALIVAGLLLARLGE